MSDNRNNLRKWSTRGSAVFDVFFKIKNRPKKNNTYKPNVINHDSNELP